MTVCSNLVLIYHINVTLKHSSRQPAIYLPRCSGAATRRSAILAKYCWAGTALR